MHGGFKLSGKDKKASVYVKLKHKSFLLSFWQEKKCFRSDYLFDLECNISYWTPVLRAKEIEE